MCVSGGGGGGGGGGRGGDYLSSIRSNVSGQEGKKVILIF